tara:strand:+ start:7449 stop:9059 length:1611 start_codon:yes stop_codon:yes gene_type:complete
MSYYRTFQRALTNALLIIGLVSTTVAQAQVDTVARGLALAPPTQAQLEAGGLRAALASSWFARLSKLQRAAARAAAFNPEDAPVATGVTMTVNAATDSSLQMSYLASANIPLFRFAGGKPTANNSGSGIYFPVSSVAPATNGNIGSIAPLPTDASAWGWKAAFGTDSEKVEIRLGTSVGSRFRVSVDGRYVTKALTPGLDFIAYIVLDFSGVKAPRTITIEASDTNAFRGVSVVANSLIWRPEPDADRIVVLATGDSYSEGQGATSPGVLAWTQILGRLMGWSDVRQVAVGGTGYLNPATGLGRSRIRNQIPRWLSINSDLTASDVDGIMFAGGYNDYSTIGGIDYTPNEIADEAFYDWKLARAAFPNALIMVYGPFSGTRGPDQRTRDMESALAAKYLAWGDKNSFYIPVSPVPAGNNSDGRTSWFSGNAAQLIFSGALSGATNGTLARSFQGTTASYTIVFSDGSTRSATLTSGSTAVSWSGAVTATATAAAYFTARGTSEYAVSDDRVHPSDAGHSLIARRAASAVRAGLSRL